MLFWLELMRLQQFVEPKDSASKDLRFFAKIRQTVQQHIDSDRVLPLWSAGLHLMFRSDPDVDPFHCSSERGQLSHPFPESWGSSELWLFDYATWSSAGLSGWGSLNFPPVSSSQKHTARLHRGDGYWTAAGMCLLAKPCCWFRVFLSLWCSGLLCSSIILTLWLSGSHITQRLKLATFSPPP